MPRYRWTRNEPFRDNRNDRRVEEGEVVELPEEVAEPAYGFVEADAEDANPGENADESEDSEPKCADENCSRTVDEPGQFCWQHEPEE